MPFAACQSNSFTSTAPSISSCHCFSVLLLSKPFLDLWDLLLVVVMVGFEVRVMQPWDYSMGQIKLDRLKLQYIGQRFRDIPIEQVRGSHRS